MYKKVIRTLLIVYFLFVLMGCSPTYKETTQLKHKKNKPPNIVLFLVDDMGWQDTSVPFWDKKTKFNQRYYTPNMQKLAKQGVQFTQAYSCAICSPSRVSLMSGMNAARHRVTNWTLYKNRSSTENNSNLVEPKWNVNGLSTQKDYENAAYVPQPLPLVLKQNGYFTLHVGKAHFGAKDTPAEDPLNIGFEVNIGGHAAGAPASYYGTENFAKQSPSVWDVPGLEEYHGKAIFLTDALTDKALKTLEQQRRETPQKPFFLYLSHYAVHVPIVADKSTVNKYYQSITDSTEAKYASMIEAMDRSLGDVMRYLEKNHLDENTIILFMSDNGGLTNWGRGGEPYTHNYPLKAGKGSTYEGGIRVPMIVKWPKVTKAGTSTDEPVIIEDFYPSIIEMAGAQYLPGEIQNIDGESFVPVLKNNVAKQRNKPLVWHYPNNWGMDGLGINFYSSIRDGDYKYIYFHDDRAPELYNIKTDIQENNNLIKTKPALAKYLSNELTKLLKERNAQMPIIKSTSKKVAWPNQSE